MTENLKTFQVILEECLPGRDPLIPCGEERFVTEMILQVDFPQREATSSPDGLKENTPPSPLPEYSAPGGLREDPGRAAESLA